MGNIVLFDERKRAIWQYFDHPTDPLLPGQNLVSRQELIASVIASCWSRGLLSFTVLNGSLVSYAATKPPQYYYASHYRNYTHLRFDGHTLSLVYFADRFLKLEHNGHLRVYNFDRDELDWKVESDICVSESNIGKCGYPMAIYGRKADLGCTELTSISCDSLQYHSLLELRDTTYFAFDISFQINSSIWFEGTKLDDCKTACLSNCSCKAVVWAVTGRKKCLLLNEVFSIMDNGEGRDRTTVFLKVQNQSPIISGGKNSRPFKNLDWTQADEEDVHLLSVFRRKAEQEQLMDMVDKNEDMQLHREAVTEMMSLAAWCLQGDFAKRPSMSLVVKAVEGLVTVETNLNYNFTSLP
ncbi:hypothetical protein RND71_037977 [Anisodus tanguticus]|uniref:Apple domain-containing protein n=1 Tax=Anisodus tanguticus TaxID=243964 RepID=A0AAE1UWK3_9SOLA|nr:hypothetical protein RND71_037977 [Anisodus tanguticus]